MNSKSSKHSQAGYFDVASPRPSPPEGGWVRAIFHTDLGWFGAVMRGGKLTQLTLPAESPAAAAQSLGLPSSDQDLIPIAGTETIFPNPVGALLAAPAEMGRASPAPTGDMTYVKVFGNIQQQLNEYGRGQRQKFDLPVSFEGTPFQTAVWCELLKIPAAETATYRDVAVRIGKPSATRAVGQAVAANPIAIVVPCHRVVRTGGALGCYAGGVAMKAQLLKLEQSSLAFSKPPLKDGNEIASLRSQ